MKHQIQKLLDRIPYVARMKTENAKLRAQVKDQGAFAAGHYYSPIPTRQEVSDGLQLNLPVHVHGDVDLRTDAQLALLKDFAAFYAEMPFPEEQSQESRYYLNQTWFCYSDAIMLYSFLRHFEPKRIVEVGSGYSSAVMLDTLDKFAEPDVAVTFIEPYPERLHSLLKPSDAQRTTILEEKVQAVNLDVFRSLQAGDLLFVDSSHVLKYASDLYHIFFEILPILPAGVHVHFHDIFYPFEYPSEWLSGGRYWNECYLLRAFLTGNQDWETTLFNDYANKQFGDYIEQNLPLCRKNFGGSMYIRKVK